MSIISPRPEKIKASETHNDTDSHADVDETATEEWLMRELPSNTERTLDAHIGGLCRATGRLVGKGHGRLLFLCLRFAILG